MPSMGRSVRQKVIGGAAVAVLLGGAAFAAVSATGQGNDRSRASEHRATRRLGPRDIEAAAAYLGESSEQLTRELSAGSTTSLGQIAQGRRGKSVQGLIEAIVASRRARLERTSATLPQRVRAEVSRPAQLAVASHGPRAVSRFTASGHLGAVAADYLGLTSAQLRDQLLAGRSLGRIARETPGKSKAGLVAALVAAKQRRIAERLAAGKITRVGATRRERRLRPYMSTLVARTFAVSHEP